MKPTEAAIERRFLRELARRGIPRELVLKETPRGRVGWPDRQVLLPNGLVMWVELKRPGERPTRLQRHWLKTLAWLGHRVGWFNDPVAAARFVDRQRQGHHRGQRIKLPGKMVSALFNSTDPEERP